MADKNQQKGKSANQPNAENKKKAGFTQRKATTPGERRRQAVKAKQKAAQKRKEKAENRRSDEEADDENEDTPTGEEKGDGRTTDKNKYAAKSEYKAKAQDPTTGSMSDSITKHYEGGQGLQDPYMTNDDVNDENKDYKQKPAAERSKSSLPTKKSSLRTGQDLTTKRSNLSTSATSADQTSKLSNLGAKTTANKSKLSAIEEETSLDKSTNSSMLQDTERDDDEGSVEKAETEANQTTTTAAPTAAATGMDKTAATKSMDRRKSDSVRYKKKSSTYSERYQEDVYQENTRDKKGKATTQRRTSAAVTGTRDPGKSKDERTKDEVTREGGTKEGGTKEENAEDEDNTDAEAGDDDEASERGTKRASTANGTGTAEEGKTGAGNQSTVRSKSKKSGSEAEDEEDKDLYTYDENGNKVRKKETSSDDSRGTRKSSFESKSRKKRKEKSIMRGKGSERHGDHVKFHESPTIYDYDRMARAQRRHDDDVYHRYKGQNDREYEYYDYQEETKQEAKKHPKRKTMNTGTLKQEYGNTWGSDRRTWDDLAEKEEPGNKQADEFQGDAQYEAGGMDRMNTLNPNSQNFSEFVPNWTMEDAGRYKELRGQLLTQMIQKEEAENEARRTMQVISDATHDQLMSRFPPSRPSGMMVGGPQGFPASPGFVDSQVAGGSETLSPFQMGQQEAGFHPIGGPPQPQHGSVQGQGDIRTTTTTSLNVTTGFGAYDPFTRFFGNLGGEHCQCAKADLNAFTLEVKNALAEFENARLPELENVKLRLERVYRDREHEIMDKFEAQLRERDMALMAQGEELCALQERTKVEIAKMEQHYLQVLDNEGDRLKRSHRQIIQEMDSEISDLKRRLLETEAEVNEKMEMVALTQQSLNEEMAEKSALSREVFQLKNSVRICEAAYAQKMEALEHEAEKLNLEDVEAFLLTLPKDELISVMLSINYMPTLREVTAFLKSLNPGMVTTLIEEHVGEIYDPSQNFLLKKVTHRLDTDVLFKEAFMRAVKIYMTVENMLEAMHRFDSKEQMIILQRANLKVAATESIFSNCLSELSQQVISRNLMKMAEIPFEPVVKAVRAMGAQELRMFCSQVDRSLVPSDRDSLVAHLQQKDPGFVKDLFKSALPELFTISGIALLITENLSLGERMKLIGGDAEYFKPTVKAMQKFENLLSRQEKSELFRAMKYSLSEHQLEKQIREILSKKPDFLDKILRRKKEDDDEKPKITVDVIFQQGPEFMLEVIKAILTNMDTQDILNVLMDLGKVRQGQRECCICWNKKRNAYACPHTHFM